MFNPLLRDDFFPVICINPGCKHSHTKEDFIQSIAKKGVIYADCGNTIFQGIHCINCGYPLLIEIPRENPLVDMREFYIMPSHNNFCNIREQLFELSHRENNSSPLHFEFICLAWDTDKLSLKQIEAYCSKPANYESLIPFYIPYIMNSADIPERLSEEIRTKKVCFRRFYPKNNPYFTFLLYCCVPSIYQPYSNANQKDTKDKRTYFYAKVCESDDESMPEKIDDDWIEHSRIEPARLHSEKYNKFYMPSLLALVSFDKLIKKIREKLTEQNVLVSDDDINNSLEETILSSFYYNFHETIQKLSFQVDFVNQVFRYADKVYWKLYYDICSFHYLSSKRQKLSEWVQKVEPGKALFVDAPMGLGKTHSIVETLVENPELSAVIFMPTRKLCEEIVERMKRMLAYKKGINKFTVFHNEEDARDIKGEIIIDEDGIPERRLKHKFLKEEVYYADGINEYECEHYRKIINRYRNGWFRRKDLCEECENKKACRFRKHNFNAPLSRIIVTTHFQYNNFSRNSNIRKWFKEGYYKINGAGEKSKREAPERNFFIIDEDIVLSQCYQPIEVDEKQFRAFVVTITHFHNQQVENNEISQKIKDKIDKSRDLIDKLWLAFTKTNKTVIIPPICPDYSIPALIREQWEKKLPEGIQDIPKYLNYKGVVPNYLAAIENAIRNGYVVQGYERYETQNGKSTKKEIKKAYLPNPTFFNLEKLPPHVFFDGTILNETFLKHKLKNVICEKFPIEFSSIWKNRVWQNTNSDLPKGKSGKEKTKAKAFIDGVMKRQDQSKKIFIVSSKKIKEAYVEKYVKEKYPHHHIVLSHYGHLRGFNEAKECDVGIMLGSFIPPDVVEIAMTLELFNEDMKVEKILEPRNNLWSLQDSNTVRVYYDKYSIIKEMSEALQLTEHRQAIARTRYLHHDVDFYILSKKPVNSYEPYLPETETLQYREDLFKPRKLPKGRYDDVKGAVMDWLTKNKNVNQTEIYENYGIRRQTVGTHLKKMEAEGVIVKEENKKNTYKLPDA